MSDEVNPVENGLAAGADVKNGMRKCQFCKEQIIEDAIKCKHCGSVLVPIGDNFHSANVNASGGGINQSVQIVSPPTPQKSDYVIHPTANYNSMLGHGWAGLVIAFILLSIIGSYGDEDAIGIAVLGAAIVIPWMIWLINKPYANKVLPAITIIMVTFGLIVSFQM